VKLHPPDCVNLAEDRIACPVCRGSGGRPETEDEQGDGLMQLLDCENCDGKGTLIRPTGRQHLSHSSLGMQLACQRRYQHAYVDRLEPIRRKSSLSLGSAFAKAVELRDPFGGAALLGVDRGYGEQEDVDRLAVDMTIVESAAAAYLSRYYWDDSLVEGADDRQLSLGAYALWRITGKPVRKVRKRFTKKPQIRQRKGESVAEFCQRIRADYRERPDFYMHEETTFRDADDMLDVERSLWDWAEQRRAAQRRGFWPMNTDRCHDYGGCDFLDKCFGGPDAEGLYRRKAERVLS
jgi:hypothetical protein